MAQVTRLGVIGSPDAAAALKPLGISVVGGTGGGFLIDVQQVHRAAPRPDGLVVAADVRRWVPVMRWVAAQNLPVVFVTGHPDAPALIDRLANGGDDLADNQAKPAKDHTVPQGWAPPSKQNTRT